jgi:hypothetical protein
LHPSFTDEVWRAIAALQAQVADDVRDMRAESKHFLN